LSPLVKLALVIAAATLLLGIVYVAQFVRHPFSAIVRFRRMRLQRAGFQRKTIQTSVGPQTNWHGGSGPLLVLLHGAGDQAGTWYKVAHELGKKYSLLMPDLAGHGDSAPASGPLSIGTILDGMEQVLDSDDWNSQRFVLAGNSLGAWIAMLYAHKHPERISRLILINGGALEYAKTDVTLTPKNREEARRAFDAILDPSSPRPASFVLDDLVRVTNNGPMARLSATSAEIPKYVLDGKLSDFPVPVDIFWGESDGLVPLDYARKMEAQLPSARLTVIERCGHAPQLECPGKLLNTLLNVLATEPPQNKKSAKLSSTNA
jgi:pimeloyl-ACP methyl ester carboxylesterase